MWARLAGALLLIAAIGIVVWVRALPRSLSGVAPQAERQARDAVRAQLTATGATADAAVDAWIASHAAEFEGERRAAEEQLKASLRYRADDGQEYACLADYDSYTWLRHAQTYLRTGSTCDAVVNGVCRDLHAHAPIGRDDLYARSLHTTAIVLAARLLRALHPGYPLPAASFWVQVIVGAAGVVPGFVVGARLAGVLGGLCAAVIAGLSPIFLVRSLGSDDDVWNVVLPLCMCAALVQACAQTRPSRRLLYAAAAGIAVGLHAAVWRGWPFAYVVFQAALLLNICAALARGWRYRSPAAAATMRAAAVVAVVFGAAAAGSVSLATGNTAIFRQIPVQIVAQARAAVSGVLGGPASTPPIDEAARQPQVQWPDVMGTVAELMRPTLPSIAGSLGGRVHFFLAWLGLLVLVLPPRAWQQGHYFVFIAGTLLYRYLLAAPPISHVTLLCLLAVPLLAAVCIGALDPVLEHRGEYAGGLLVTAWFLAALFASFTGMRFVMLLVAPSAIAIGTAVGRLYRLASGAVAARLARHRLAAQAALFTLLLGMVLALPITQGYAVARSYLPRMNRAWWESLSHLRESSPADAIVNTWWDYGYFAEYVADRRVIADGASLQTKTAHWFGHALMAPSEREALGLFRMLDCSNDTAHDLLTDRDLDPLTAYGLLFRITAMDAPQARSALAAHAITAADQDDILRATHCDPPDAYLVLTTEMIASPGWRQIGSWDARRAFVAARAKRITEADAVRHWSGRLDIEPDTAAQLYRDAVAISSDDDRRQFIAPALGYLQPDWLPCTAVPGSIVMQCAVGTTSDAAGTVVDAFRYDPASPQSGRLQLRPPGQGGTAAITESIPALVIIVGDNALTEYPQPAATDRRLAVLLDPANRRVLIGSPMSLRSEFTRLMFLDGRYPSAFTRIDERRGYRGERVLTWRINWRAGESADSASSARG